MLIVAAVLAGLAALVHVYIFWLEALAFSTAGRRVFGIGEADAETLKPVFYNQGYYNLFLAIGTTAGIGILHANRSAGVALILFGCGSMLTAALVLVSSDASRLRAAVVQGLFPGLALLALLFTI